MNQKKSQTISLPPKENRKMVKCSQVFRVLSRVLSPVGFRLRASNKNSIQSFTLIKDEMELRDCMKCPQDGTIPLESLEKIVKETVNEFAKQYEIFTTPKKTKAKKAKTKKSKK